mmetsp:Transcript_29400/g.71563  ORF Transcript_29400/g.71563 Transcript_29400/m.71563 type:complete len:222 (-) Transcript_29400:7-672(-)
MLRPLHAVLVQVPRARRAEALIRLGSHAPAGRFFRVTISAARRGIVSAGLPESGRARFFALAVVLFAGGAYKLAGLRAVAPLAGAGGVAILAAAFLRGGRGLGAEVADGAFLGSGRVRVALGCVGGASGEYRGGRGWSGVGGWVRETRSGRLGSCFAHCKRLGEEEGRLSAVLFGNLTFGHGANCGAALGQQIDRVDTPTRGWRSAVGTVVRFRLLCDSAA